MLPWFASCVTVVPAFVHAASNTAQELDHNENRSEFWPRNGSFNAPLRRSTTYTDDSPACDVSK